MDELEEIRRRKLAEIQNRKHDELREEQRVQEQINELEIMVRRFLSKEALQRYGNIKAAHPEKAVQLLVVLGNAIQKGKVREEISDEGLKALLRDMQPRKKEFKINIR
ncbi:hypothetical protein KY358_05545 [Candidatus Woesearchaeota archaeon]|nr:hypothetical protein [Candidatus Woesearchaeota archaeon]